MYKWEIYFKELVCVIREAAESQDLQLASLRAMSFNVLLQTHSKDLRTRTAGVSYNQESGRLKTLEEPMFQFESKGWKSPMC